jgi:hypothetical protein
MASPAAAFKEPTMFCSDHEIERIGHGLVDRSLPKSEWTHAAHFAAVLWLMRARRDLDPGAEMPSLIRLYNEATGVANTDSGGYHETITLASIRAARSILERHGDNVPLYRVASELMVCELGRSDWLLRYWSRTRLFSVEARRLWVEPDLEPLPF